MEQSATTSQTQHVSLIYVSIKPILLLFTLPFFLNKSKLPANDTYPFYSRVYFKQNTDNKNRFDNEETRVSNKEITDIRLYFGWNVERYPGCFLISGGLKNG